MNKLFFFFLATVFLFSFAATSHAGDAFVQGGLIVRPSDVDVSDRWLIDFGSDYGVAPDRQVTLGFEIATAYYTEDFGNETLHIVPINGWANVKYKVPLNGFRPFGGGGLGLISTYIRDGGSDYGKDFGFHLVGGIELGSITGAGLVLQIQGQKAFSNSDLPFTWIFLGGIKF